MVKFVKAGTIHNQLRHKNNITLTHQCVYRANGVPTI